MIIYDKTGQTILATINTDCIEAFVEEERNGLFELRFVFPATNSNFNHLAKENIVKCNASDTLKDQKFRIYNTRKTMNNMIEVYARHISFDLAYDFVEAINIENQSCEYALNTIFRNSQFSRHYRAISNIIEAQDFNISRVNPLEAIAGAKGSIVDTYGTGAEILRDNETISVLNARGHDNDIVIAYSKNLKDIKIEEDTTDLITRIIPVATKRTENEDILVKGNVVDSPYINNYSHPYIKEVDFTNKFKANEEVTTLKLTTLAQYYFRDNRCDIAKCNYKIDFVALSKCIGFEGGSENIGLCDKVTIQDTRYNVDTQSKVIKIVYNVLKDRIEELVLGEPKTTLGDVIGGGGQQGEPGRPGQDGKPGADGNIGDFPNSLPQIPTLTAKVLGFASVDLSWTFENKVYYSYEVYASKKENFIPNTFDLIFEGQASSFLHQVKPNETWYYRACAVNSHGNRTAFSTQIKVETRKLDSFEEYFSSLAVGELVAAIFSVDYMEAGIIQGHWINAKNLSVTDGNGKRTLDIDSFGNVNLDVASFKVKNESVFTQNEAIIKINEAINNYKKEVDREFNEVNNAYSDLETEMNGAFKDGIVDEAEAKAINERLVALEKEKLDLDKEYNVIYSNTHLNSTTEKTNLLNTKNSYNTAYTNLKNSITTGIVDGKIIASEIADINSKTDIYKAASANYKEAFVKAVDKVGSVKISTVSTELSQKISKIEQLTDSIKLEVTEKVSTSDLSGIIDEKTQEALNNYKIEVDREFTETQDSIDSLKNLTDNVFADGIVTVAEKEAIKKQKTIIEKEHKDVIVQANALLNAAELNNTNQKNDLNTSKLALENSYLNIAKEIDKILGIKTLKSSIVVNPTSYEFSPDEKIVIRHNNSSINYGYLYGLEGVVNSESYTSNTITFPSYSKKGTYNCYFGTYVGQDWTQSNNFTVVIKDKTTPPPTVVEVESISLNKTSLNKKVNENDTLIATINPSNATNKNLTWSSSNTSVATINGGGLLVCKGKGNAVITVKSNNNKQATCNVTVTEEVVFPPVDGEGLENALKHYTDTLKILREKMQTCTDFIAQTKTDKVDKKYNERCASIELTANSITDKVESVERKTTTLENNVTTVEETIKKVEEKITDDAIINTVSSKYYKKNEIDLNYAKKTELKQLDDSLNLNISESLKQTGGENLILNGAFNSRDLTAWKKWGNIAEPIVWSGNLQSGHDWAVKITTTGSNQGIEQQVTGLIVGKIYTASCMMYSESGIQGIMVRNGGTYSGNHLQAPQRTWTLVHFEFEAKENTTWFQIGTVNSSCSSGTVWTTGIQVKEGKLQPWTPNQNELYTANYKFDKDGLTGKFEDGTYSKWGRKGIEWFDSENMSHAYHCLVKTGTFNVSSFGDGNWTKCKIQLPNYFKGKYFEPTCSLAGYQVGGFSIDTITATIESYNIEEGWFIIQVFCYTQQQGYLNNININWVVNA